MSTPDQTAAARPIRQAIGAIEKNVARFYQARPAHAIRGETTITPIADKHAQTAATTSHPPTTGMIHGRFERGKICAERAENIDKTRR
jgi:hypothetical protein